MPDGPHELEVRALSANVRAFGVWMEREGPGVVLDSIGIQGCRIRFLDQTDDAHWAEQLRLRDPSLTVFEYGMNESEDGELYPLDQYEATMKAVLLQVKAALPKAALPPGRAPRPGGEEGRRLPEPARGAQARGHPAQGERRGRLRLLGHAGRDGRLRRRWPSGTSAGSAGPTWRHPSSAGAEVLGNWVYLALMEAYEGYKARQAP